MWTYVEVDVSAPDWRAHAAITASRSALRMSTSRSAGAIASRDFLADVNSSQAQVCLRP
jgi:hypothetical protein